MERFWSKVDTSGECWIWLAYKDKDGYGTFHLNGKDRRAHRAVFMIKGIDIPKDKIVCHTCDNPSCVNPEHLYIGTPKTNMEDKVGRGRARSHIVKKYKCPQGHNYNESNTYVNTRGSKVCIKCKRKANREYARNKRRAGQ